MDIIEILDSDSDGDKKPAGRKPPPEQRKVSECNASRDSDSDGDIGFDGPRKKRKTDQKKKATNPYLKQTKEKLQAGRNPKETKKKKNSGRQLKDHNLPTDRELQSGLVYQEDVDHVRQSVSCGPAKKQSSLKRKPSKSNNDAFNSDEDETDNEPRSAEEYAKQQYTTRVRHQLPPLLYHDPVFVAGDPASIDGVHKVAAKKRKGKSDDEAQRREGLLAIAPPKCRCRPAQSCKLAYSTREHSLGKPYYTCAKSSSRCNHFSWAFQSHTLHWYRFGAFNGHCLVHPVHGPRASDLVQGKVGDCWFLSALAVVAERPDLINRLLVRSTDVISVDEDEGAADSYGVVEMKLFVDGFWETVTVDDFLPCLVDQGRRTEENALQRAMKESLKDMGVDREVLEAATKPPTTKNASSKFDRLAIADRSRATLLEAKEFLHQDRFSRDPSFRANPTSPFFDCLRPLEREVAISDLAYSKTTSNQLWVPFLEKAYSKVHGSYKAISGGQVEEAFLDLTGAPTAMWIFDSPTFEAVKFWNELMTFRREELPMGCGTSQSQVGVVGMHAYSILDVREIKNVRYDFFLNEAVRGMGGVSGFVDTAAQGIVRLLRIRNPHGRGEWQGNFSDKSPIWKQLLKSMGDQEPDGAVVDLTDQAAKKDSGLERTMRNDGTFWIDYDSFLQAFHNVDVVFAFKGNHAKSFGSTFPHKKSTHRTTRAFELSVIGRQPGETAVSDTVEVYVSIIQKTKRGARHGRSDRMKSYKPCDTGILVGTRNGNSLDFDAVDGRFFGLTRNGHIRIMLERRESDKRYVLMPISFGHPAATDEERSFVVRVVANSPLMVREMPKCPPLQHVIQEFCFGQKIRQLSTAGTSRHIGKQGARSTVFEEKDGNSFLFKIIRIDCLGGEGGTVLLYLVVNDRRVLKSDVSTPFYFTVDINCKGMLCRTVQGLEESEITTKGKMFEASWRRFTLVFKNEDRSRLLCCCVQSGVQYQMGSIKVRKTSALGKGPISKFVVASPGKRKRLDCEHGRYSDYEENGIFASTESPRGGAVSDCVNLLDFSQPIESNRPQQPIVIDGGPNATLEAAIRASQKDAYANEIEKAIAISLQEQ